MMSNLISLVQIMASNPNFVKIGESSLQRQGVFKEIKRRCFMVLNKIAMSVERRSNPNRQNGLKWAGKMFGQMMGDPHSIFIMHGKEKINVG